MPEETRPSKQTGQDSKSRAPIYLDTRSLRRRERRRLCRRWKFLEGPSPFFLLVYSDMAEKIVKGFSETDNDAIKIFASHFQREMPTPFVHACIFLEGMAQRVANSGHPVTDDEAKQLRGRAKEIIYGSN
ncbi:hypothetical protein F5Y11DRAFT_320813 [Daldinia sp. FL1419]|nr:hypothetical protein F5Y11DRAFT_320813 [Daldinia sp. FL1419]